MASKWIEGPLGRRGSMHKAIRWGNREVKLILPRYQNEFGGFTAEYCIVWPILSQLPSNSPMQHLQASLQVYKQFNSEDGRTYQKSENISKRDTEKELTGRHGNKVPIEVIVRTQAEPSRLLVRYSWRPRREIDLLSKPRWKKAFCRRWALEEGRFGVLDNAN